MITTLRFRREPSGACGGRLVRELQFEPITDLPLSTVCLAANQARMQLSQLFGCELTLDVFAPALVAKGSERALFEGSTVYASRGTICDAYVVFREREARRIAAVAFGEERGDENATLSALEERALQRIARELAALCVPFCGAMSGCERLEPDATPRCATYFELRVGAPFEAVIGIGLSQDPLPTPGALIDRSLLTNVAVDVRAQFAEATLDALTIAGWKVGTTVALATKIGAATKLKVGDCVIASGDCGIRADNNAVAIRTTALREATT